MEQAQHESMTLSLRQSWRSIFINQRSFSIQDKNIHAKYTRYNESDKKDVLMLQRN